MMFCVEALRNACQVMVDKCPMEERVAVAKRTSQRGLAQGIMSEASRNGQPWTEVEEVKEGADKYNQKEMDSWWNPAKVDDKAWRIVPVALFVRMLPPPHHESCLIAGTINTINTIGREILTRLPYPFARQFVRFLRFLGFLRNSFLQPC